MRRTGDGDGAQDRGGRREERLQRHRRAAPPGARGVGRGDEIGRSSSGLGSAKAPAGARARRARRRGARPRRGAGKEAAAPGWQRGTGRTSVRAPTGADAAIASQGAARGCRVRDEGRSRERERGGRARAHIGFVGTWQRCAGSDSGRRTRRSGVAQGMQDGGEGLRRRRSGPAGWPPATASSVGEGIGLLPIRIQSEGRKWWPAG